MKYYTDIEQSKKLLELGLDPKTADMHYPYNYHRGALSDIADTNERGVCVKDLPCWSIGALMDAMPKANDYPFGFASPFVGYTEGSCVCVYLDEEGKQYHKEDRNTIIQACYRMMVWLLKNNYIDIKQD